MNYVISLIFKLLTIARCSVIYWVPGLAIFLQMPQQSLLLAVPCTFCRPHYCSLEGVLSHKEK